MSTRYSGSDLSLIRGDRLLFKGVNFSLTAGEALVIEGANGSGKTSLMRVLAGLMDADRGDVQWNGVSTRINRQNYREQLLWYGHRTGCKLDLTPQENLRCEQALRPGSGRELTDALRELGIERLAKLPMRVLSAGQQRRVALARLLTGGAPLWLLDEPFTNLDTAGIELIERLLAEHLGRGGICVMASHRAVAASIPHHSLVLS
ncbi:cytochrome c biogenesis heme-transporting ATPase CcmA [Woeseia oceani]|uniref:Heme ABC exporter, ATP-binding protein CcmA n=1 Tax=Woeseia oceani TaxID=1548547 RepID=A0A193LFL5_9GAMM|nr:cytochrome c biogenesis heme-transporting ATPase CcmA [Woeseia oceani]ANO51325.1 heme ABC exporter, ATP-binding protein CcmA [Woeseia oceani]